MTFGETTTFQYLCGGTIVVLALGVFFYALATAAGMKSKKERENDND